MVAVHSLAVVDHSLGEVAAEVHVTRDVPLVVPNEAVPSALAAWKHQGDCHSHNAVVAALLPLALPGGVVAGCTPCRELQLAPCSPLLAVEVYSHVVVVTANVHEEVESGCDLAAADGGHHRVVALQDNRSVAHCLDAAWVVPLAAYADHALEEAHVADAAVVPPASVEAP